VLKNSIKNRDRVIPSDMVSQLELQGMRMEVVLLLQVGLIVFAHVVIDERDRNDKGNGFLTIKAEYCS